MGESGVPKKEWLSQYKFRGKIALAWIQYDEVSIKTRKKSNLSPTVSVLTKRKAAPQDSVSSKTDSGRPKRRQSLGDFSLATTTPTTVSAITTESESKKKMSTPFKDSNLLAANGPFKRQLKPLVGHYCVAVEGRPKCALHRWASGLEQISNVFNCSYCGISLCVECFVLFHPL
jgi:hypothetical protein